MFAVLLFNSIVIGCPLKPFFCMTTTFSEFVTHSSYVISTFRRFYNRKMQCPTLLLEHLCYQIVMLATSLAIFPENGGDFYCHLHNTSYSFHHHPTYKVTCLLSLLFSHKVTLLAIFALHTMQQSVTDEGLIFNIMYVSQLTPIGHLNNGHVILVT